METEGEQRLETKPGGSPEESDEWIVACRSGKGCFGAAAL
jgi:hypothetical protein